MKAVDSARLGWAQEENWKALRAQNKGDEKMKWRVKPGVNK
jgi:hypothetical protein